MNHRASWVERDPQGSLTPTPGSAQHHPNPSPMAESGVPTLSCGHCHKRNSSDKAYVVIFVLFTKAMQWQLCYGSITAPLVLFESTGLILWWDNLFLESRIAAAGSVAVSWVSTRVSSAGFCVIVLWRSDGFPSMCNFPQQQDASSCFQGSDLL